MEKQLYIIKVSKCFIIAKDESYNLYYDTILRTTKAATDILLFPTSIRKWKKKKKTLFNVNCPQENIEGGGGGGGDGV